MMLEAIQKYSLQNFHGHAILDLLLSSLHIMKFISILKYLRVHYDIIYGCLFSSFSECIMFSTSNASHVQQCKKQGLRLEGWSQSDHCTYRTVPAVRAGEREGEFRSAGIL